MLTVEIRTEHKILIVGTVYGNTNKRIKAETHNKIKKRLESQTQPSIICGERNELKTEVERW